jgi:hypothetical protein
VTHFVCIGSETRNEAGIGSEKGGFIGEFGDFGERDAQRAVSDWWIVMRRRFPNNPFIHLPANPFNH